ncbi:MAG: hypothetical protein KGP28_01385 [Bdellovibrionales bacterium]|nr:hypothetical protein [Bdellovibrionales bacterium]
MARKILPLIHEEKYSVSADSTLDRFILIPPDPRSPKLHFRVIRDDLTRGILFDSEKCDVLFDTMSLSKTDFFRRAGAKVSLSKGFHISYLGFNLRSPILSNLAVRRAIQKAIPVPLWIRAKYFGFVEPVPGFEFQADIVGANLELDQAGFSRSGEESRFTLRYLTTPVREGSELAMLIRDALKKIRIAVDIIPLEPSLFFSKLNRSDFDFFGSRIPRSSSVEPVLDFFATGGRRNYFSYSSPDLDRRIRANGATTLEEILPVLRKDLPLIPLFSWNHGVLLSKRIRTPKEGVVVSDDSFRFLSTLQLN